jgi:hypothetical protein
MSLHMAVKIADLTREGHTLVLLVLVLELELPGCLLLVVLRLRRGLLVVHRLGLLLLLLLSLLLRLLLLDLLELLLLLLKLLLLLEHLLPEHLVRLHIQRHRRRARPGHGPRNPRVLNRGGERRGPGGGRCRCGHLRVGLGGAALSLRLRLGLGLGFLGGRPLTTVEPNGGSHPAQRGLWWGARAGGRVNRTAPDNHKRSCVYQRKYRSAGEDILGSEPE